MKMRRRARLLKHHLASRLKNWDRMHEREVLRDASKHSARSARTPAWPRCSGTEVQEVPRMPPPSTGG